MIDIFEFAVNEKLCSFATPDLNQVVNEWLQNHDIDINPRQYDGSRGDSFGNVFAVIDVCW
ncbi:MAG: hypothetical protein NPIRA05_04390 [Nitrospirales bacterium]|nr:MAG: hypothetical protein NPIRA05_04390 [Nitrospirales bacterium]